jgi:hypothetical protein
MPTGSTLCGVRENGTTFDFGLGSATESDWSLYVWYMDKNRELPPGTAFDKFRRGDSLRRKMERSAKPLYDINYLEDGLNYFDPHSLDGIVPDDTIKYKGENIKESYLKYLLIIFVIILSFWMIKDYGKQEILNHIRDNRYNVLKRVDRFSDWYSLIIKKSDEIETKKFLDDFYNHTLSNEKKKSLHEIIDGSNYEVVYPDEIFDIKVWEKLANDPKLMVSLLKDIFHTVAGYNDTRKSLKKKIWKYKLNSDRILIFEEISLKGKVEESSQRLKKSSKVIKIEYAPSGSW